MNAWPYALTIKFWINAFILHKHACTHIRLFYLFSISMASNKNTILIIVNYVNTYNDLLYFHVLNLMLLKIHLFLMTIILTILAFFEVQWAMVNKCSHQKFTGVVSIPVVSMSKHKEQLFCVNAECSSHYEKTIE